MSTEKNEWSLEKNQRLVELLDKLEHSDSQIAARIGISRGGFSKIRHGQKPSNRTLLLLQIVYGINTKYILDGAGGKFLDGFDPYTRAIGGDHQPILDATNLIAEDENVVEHSPHYQTNNEWQKLYFESEKAKSRLEGELKAKEEIIQTLVGALSNVQQQQQH